MWTPSIEGILVSKGRGAEVLLRWGHFWPGVLESAVNVVSLVLAQTVTRGFDANMDWGGPQPYTTYARSLDKEIFLRCHRRMLDIVAGTLWEEKHGRSDYASLDEFRLLILMLYCIYEQGDVRDMVRDLLPGYREFEVFPQWVGSLMIRRTCGYDGAIPVYKFLLGTYVEKCGLQKLWLSR